MPAIGIGPGFGVMPSIYAQAQALLRSRSDTLLIPGVGTVNGFASGTYSDSAGTTPAVLNDFIGRWVDAGAGGLVFVQATTANKPQLSRRLNQLTKTEDFSAADWAAVGSIIKSVDKLTPGVTTGQQYVQQIRPAKYLKIKAKPGGYGFLGVSLGNTGMQVIFDLNSGTIPTSSGTYTASISGPDAEGFFDCSVYFSTADRVRLFPAQNNPGINGSASGNGVDGVLVKKAQFLESDSTLNYQYVNTSTDYSAEGFPYLVRFDATDTLAATIPAGYESCTIINAAPGGQVTLTAQNIVGTYTIGPNITTHGRIIARNALTAPELAIYQQLANKLAGL